MVRAAFKGDRRNFHQPLASFSVMGMAQDKNDNASGNRDQSSPDEAALSARLGSLDHRLSEIRDNRKLRTDQTGTESGDTAARTSAMALGFRLSSELVAGVVVGAAIGWGVDRWLSTSPFGLIVFLLLGFTAGVVNVVRAAGVASRKR
jgi:ATP synthase protein I